MLKVNALIFLFLLQPLCEPNSIYWTRIDEPNSSGSSLSVELDSGAFINGIVYKRQKLGGRHVLQFRKIFGLKVQTPLTPDDFAAAVLDVMEVFEKDGQRVDEIQVDLNLVRSTLDAAAIATKSAIGSRSTIASKDVEVTNAIREAIRGSEQVLKTCQAVVIYSYKCRSHTIGMNPVYFEENNFDKNSDFLRSHPNAGLHPRMWFSIELIRDN